MLTAEQRCDAQKIAELEVRRYMDVLFERTLPRTIRSAVKAHDADVEAHCVLFKRQWSTLRLVLVAFAAGAGLAGAGGVAKLFGVL